MFMECNECEHIKDCHHQCMDLPEGKTCRDCTHVVECTELFGAEESDRKCGFEPILFQESGRRKADITQSAVKCIDMEIEPDGIQMQHETWFDVDAYFGTDTRDKPDVWVCFYTYWRPLTGVWAVYEIETPKNAIRHDWALTKDEKAFFLKAMEKYCKKETGKSLNGLWDSCNAPAERTNWFGQIVRSLEKDKAEGRVWEKDGQILCETKDGANAVADLIQALYGAQGESVVVTTGYYDQKEDERNGSKKDSMRLYSTKYFIELRRAFIQL